MSLKSLISKKSYFMEHMVQWMDHIDNPIIISKEIYSDLKKANSDFMKLNRYIYENHFLNLLEYLNIKNKKLHDSIIAFYENTSFEDSNFINRWDYFLCKDWIKIAEINNDTPWWYIETCFLNWILWKDLVDPNNKFIKNFSESLKSYWVKNLYIVWSLAEVEDYKLMTFVKNIAKESWINASVWYFDSLDIKEDWFYLWSYRIDAIFKYYPIDQIYDSYEMTEIEKFAKAWSLKLLNNPLSYVFQLKSYYSFLWENIEIFPKNMQNIINNYIPLSIRLDNSLIKENLEKIIQEKKDWVLKDTNNREWNNIFIGSRTTDTIWSKYLNDYLWNQYWILQKKFEAIPIAWFQVNFWIYNIKNKYSGIFVRMTEIWNKVDIRSFATPIWIKG